MSGSRLEQWDHGLMAAGLGWVGLGWIGILVKAPPRLGDHEAEAEAEASCVRGSAGSWLWLLEGTDLPLTFPVKLLVVRERKKGVTADYR